MERARFLGSWGSRWRCTGFIDGEKLVVATAKEDVL